MDIRDAEKIKKEYDDRSFNGIAHTSEQLVAFKNAGRVIDNQKVQKKIENAKHFAKCNVW